MYQHFTEYRIHESLSPDANSEYIVVVNKYNVERCAFVDKDNSQDLLDCLKQLDGNISAGWPVDQDVGVRIATYSITTHPELFI